MPCSNRVNIREEIFTTSNIRGCLAGKKVFIPESAWTHSIVALLQA